MHRTLRALALATGMLLIALPAAALASTPPQNGCPASGQLTAVADLEALGDYQVPARIDDPANGGNGDGYVCAFPLPDAVRVAWGQDITIYMFNENTRTERKP